MNPSHEKTSSKQSIGTEMMKCVADLFPLHRSITGDGVRKTFQYLQHFAPVEIHEVPTGTQVFEWTVPQEWAVNDAYIAGESGHRIVDYLKSNLQVLSYSQPMKGRFTLDELRDHLFTLSRDLDASWIPYRTAYFRDAWGFCVSHRQMERLEKHTGEVFDVVIDSEFYDGNLTYGEIEFPGESDETILIYTHTCHPSLANDNLSGIAVATFLARQIEARVKQGETLKRTYKFVFAPATIGAITWLATNKDSLNNIYGGLVLSLLGDQGDFTYKKSRIGDSLIDRAACLTLKNGLSARYKVREFTPFGYDERQFCSPGINLPVGCLMRTPNAEFPEYHTSADNLDFISEKSLEDSLKIVSRITMALEHNETPINQSPYCEPQLGQRGLYRAFGERDDRGRLQEAIVWILNLADGKHDLLEIADRADLPFETIIEAVAVLRQHNLV